MSSDSAALAICPCPKSAYFAPFHAPPTVDQRVVHVNGVITFIIAVVAAVFAERTATEWVVSCLAGSAGHIAKYRVRRFDMRSFN